MKRFFGMMTALAVALLLMAPGAAQAASVTATDAGTGWPSDPLFGARARAGNNQAEAGDWELGLGKSVGVPGAFNQDGYVYGNGESNGWVLSYDGDDTLSFEFGDSDVLNYTLNGGPYGVDAVYVRAYSAYDGASLTGSVNALNGRTVGGDNSFNVGFGKADGTTKLLQITDADGPLSAFELIGDAALNWGSVAPTDEHTKIDIMATGKAVPSPSASLAGLALLGGLGLTRAGRRRRAAA